MSDTSAFIDYLAAHRAEVDSALARSYDVRVEDGLERYLYGPLGTYSANGGKRVRPVICLLACEAVGGRPEAALVSACSVEQFQTAALIHDDIADEGELRRGEPCLHLTQGVGIATNCGDLALVRVTRGVLDDEGLSPAARIRILDELTSMMERTCEGQALDLGWARDDRWDVSVDDYLDMATRKTAHYSASTPLAIGAIAGNGTDAQVEGLRAFGMDAGLAFQLQDDLLNLVGDADAQGKDFRSDITEGKRTLLAVHALAHADDSARGELLSILSAHTTEQDDLGRAVAIIEATGSIDYARGLAHDLVDRAKARISDVDLLDGPKQTLLAMADFFVERLG